MSFKKAVNDMNFDNSNKYKDIILKLSGGHVGLLRAMIRSVPNNTSLIKEDDLLKTNEIEHMFSKIWGGFSEETQLGVLQNNTFTNEYLLKTKLKDSTGKWFSSLFKLFVKNLQSHNDNSPKVDIQDLLSYQELLVYNLLSSRNGQIVTKEDIAKLIWKEEWLEKYLDWAIAQIISQLRKKLSLKSITIKASKGEGYVLIV
ncbi:MAG TPA: helix-turn-helix domain-containing protein [Candidatus Dojkabacteria bacterium]|nr:helix-turn-helix domain-containing protein [Candidatus Dojkabacteria bacterium]